MWRTAFVVDMRINFSQESKGVHSRNCCVSTMSASRFAKWDEHNPLLEKSLIEALMYVFEHADNDHIRKLAEAVY